MRNFLILAIFAILLLFGSNIYGYFRFQCYCSSEGGLKIYEKLERNVGWWAKDYNDAHTAAVIPSVGFVRYTDKDDGNTYDLRYLGGDPQYDKAFEKKYSNATVGVVYKWIHVNSDIPQEIRLGMYGYEVYEIKKNKLLVQYHMFGYSKFEPQNTILGAPSGVSCFDEGGKRFQDLPRSLSEISTAFKN